VRGDLERSQFSLHLIGENYGLIPESENVSSVQLQYNLALKRAATPSFSQLVWIPRWLKTSDKRQLEFIESVRRTAHAGTEVLQDTREDMKSYLLDRLKSFRPLDETTQPEVIAYQEPLYIYLIHNKKDYDSIKQLQDYLLSENFEVLGVTQSGGGPKFQNQCFSYCHAAVIFQDQADDRWREQKLWDLRKAAGSVPHRRPFPWAVYFAGTMTPEKDGFKSREATVIREAGAFPPQKLRDFVRQVRNQQQTPNQTDENSLPMHGVAR
jgi:hypothetical protein